MTAVASVDLVLPNQESFSAARAGAIGTVNRELALALGRAGVRTRVISPFFSGAPYADVEIARMRYRHERSLPVRLAAKIENSLRRRAPDLGAAFRAEVEGHLQSDVVVVHNDPLLATQLANTSRRVILWLHNLLAGSEGRALAGTPAEVRIVAVSEYVRKWTIETHGVAAARISVNHNGVDADRFRPPETWQPHRPLRVVMHARVDPNKGQLLAANAVARLREDGIPVDFTVIGAVQTFGMSKHQVSGYEADLTRALGRAKAHHLGRVPAPQIPSLLTSFDCALALPTVPEPFSLAALEAMASGCALVAVPLGGLTEVIGDAALKVDPEPNAVAGAILALATDESLLREYRTLGRQRALAFGWDKTADRLLQLLRS